MSRTARQRPRSRAPWVTLPAGHSSRALPKSIASIDVTYLPPSSTLMASSRPLYLALPAVEAGHAGVRSKCEHQCMRTIQSYPNAFRPPLASVILHELWSSTMAMPLDYHNCLDPISAGQFPHSCLGAHSDVPQRIDAAAEFVIAW